MKIFSSSKGFTLVSTLILVAILVTLVTLAGVLVSSSLRNVSFERDINHARASAISGLEIAIGELQTLTGPDQRITASASLLDSSENLYSEGNIAVTPERENWVGVWKSDREAILRDAYPSGEEPSYDPSKPDEKEFIGWLVSSTDADGNFELPSELEDVQEIGSSTTPQGIDDYVRLISNLDDTSYIQAKKVSITDATDGLRGAHYFAFAVEDESLKADLTWKESEVTDVADSEAARLVVAPGPDYATLKDSTGTSVFETVVNAPITSATNPFIDSSISPMRDLSDLKTLLDVDVEDWLIDMRGDITYGSRGVMADVKLGGLKRDLSLAFEMDDAAETSAASQPEKFNRQVGEFVGDPDVLIETSGDTSTEVLGDDPNASPRVFDGMPMPARYLYRITSKTGTFFPDYFDPTRLNNDNNRSASVLRGPNWWALRDYYNLYKRLEGGSGDYSMKARAYYPDRPAVGSALGNRVDTHANDVGMADFWDTDLRRKHQNNQGRRDSNTYYYLARPSAASYAPTLLGTTTLFNLKLEGDQLKVGFDPIFYLWNPYNRDIRVDGLAIYFDRGFPGKLRVQIKKGTSTLVSDKRVEELVESNFDFDNTSLGSNQKRFSFSLLPQDPGGQLILSAGEIVAASLSEETGQLSLGYDAITNSSGLFMDDLGFEDAAGNSITPSIESTDEINIGYYDSNQSSRFYVSTSLTDSSLTGSLLSAANEEQGSEIQNIHMQLNSDSEEFVDEGLEEEIFDPWLLPSELTGAKKAFAVFTYLAKPAAWSGEGPNPVDVFGRYNPFPMLINKDYWSATTGNYVYNIVTSSEPNDLLNNNGVNFSASTRRAFFGKSYDSSASNIFVMSNIPSGPLLSLAEFSHGNFSPMASDPFHAIGNSWSSAVFPARTPHAALTQTSTLHTGSDLSWLVNDALFDRYMLSGIAPDFSIGSSGYNKTGSISESLERFYSGEPESTASPLLAPYIPRGKSKEGIITELLEDDGYRKMAAYSLVDGVFNVNSVSIPAWASLLKANRGLTVAFSQSGTSDSDNNETPFPSSREPFAEGTETEEYWGGFSRLSDDQIWDDNDTPLNTDDDTGLAAEIVKQVKERGPFMSLSDFINRRVGGTSTTELHFKGALQAAIDESGINSLIESSAGGVDTQYGSTRGSQKGAAEDGYLDHTTRNIPTDITQADLLQPLAPRLTARADTFRIRSYGESRIVDRDGNETGEINSRAMCEAVIQRIPDFCDSTELSGNEAWDNTNDLTPLNKILGRRYKLVQFRWLNPEEY